MLKLIIIIGTRGAKTAPYQTNSKHGNSSTAASYMALCCLLDLRRRWGQGEAVRPR